MDTYPAITDENEVISSRCETGGSNDKSSSLDELHFG